MIKMKLLGSALSLAAIAAPMAANAGAPVRPASSTIALQDDEEAAAGGGAEAYVIGALALLAAGAGLYIAIDQDDEELPNSDD